ncbi:hypothetical protein [Phenylobacterium sp.]|uniref:hypothetical protein n=1 Tax=Phenylobacterium sp. TaxID=1871053 RepID=UPI0025F1C883|nr:hypothetical protein [Phenylobacterium sp.]
MERLPRDAVLRQARRLGLAHGRALVLDDMDELFYACDLAIYTAAPDHLSGIERYGRAARAAPESDEAQVLAAMRRARFTFLQIERRHPVAGLIAREATQGDEVWLMDEGLEASAWSNSVIATRIYAPDEFYMTAGIIVPLEPEILAGAVVLVPFLDRKPLAEALQDRRFAEALYRVALANGISDRTCYLETPDDASRLTA